MRVNKYQPAETVQELPTTSTLFQRSRLKIQALAFGVSLSSAACADDNTSSNSADSTSDGDGMDTGMDSSGGGSDSEETGTSGDETSDTGDTGDTGTDTGDTGMDDPCDIQEFVGLDDMTLAPGEAGTLTLSGLAGDKALYNGGGIAIKTGNKLDIDVEAKYVLADLLAVNYPGNFNTFQDESGIELVIVNAAKEMVDNGEGLGICVANRLEFDEDTMMDEEIRPDLTSPNGHLSTVVHFDGTDYVDPADPGASHSSNLMANQTTSKITKSGEYLFLNSKPVLQASATSSATGIVTIDFTGTEDEGHSTTQVFNGIQVEVEISGIPYTFSQSANPSEEHLWISDSPLPAGMQTLDIKVNGLNAGQFADPTDDQSPTSTDVAVAGPCDGVICVNGTCDDMDGICDCDPDWGGAQCDIPNPGPCDENPEPCNGGDCVDNGGVAECSNCPQGQEGDNCETCSAGNVQSINNPAPPVSCVDNKCDPEPCTNASCTMPDDDSYTCACNDPVNDMPSQNDPDTCVDKPCEPEPCQNGGVCGLDGNDGADCSCVGGYTGNVCEIAPAPVITNLVIDCSSTVDICIAGWGTPYPVTFTVTNEVGANCSISSKVLNNGGGAPGVNSAVTLNGNDASAEHTTTGVVDGAEIEIQADCNGPGGNAVPATTSYVGNG